MERMYYTLYHTSSEDALRASLHGLLHDAAEAYIGDIPSPLRQMPALQGFNEYEQAVLGMIYKKYGVDPDGKSRALLALCDRNILHDEATALMKGGMVANWHTDGPLAPAWIKPVTPWSAAKAERKFLERFRFLKEYV
jgi:hypothetical protein